MPYLVEATIIPTALFYLLLVLGDMRWALAGALIWSYGAVVRRVVGDRPVPALLILATLGITVRTIVYLLSSNDFVYFVQPILRTTLTGLMFAGSVAVGRPLIARFANDFCPLSPDVRVRPGILRLFKRLTILWALVNVRRRRVEPRAAPDRAGIGVRRHGRRLGVDRDLLPAWS